MIARILTRTLVLGVMSATAVAQAKTPVTVEDNVPTVQVNYQDLDLTTEKGAMTLYQRIAGAAKAVCPAASALDQRAYHAARRCVDQAISRKITDLNSPQLAKVGASRGRRA